MAKITPSGIPVLTTYIAATQFDMPALAKQYDIYSISYQHAADKQEKAEIKRTIPSLLYKTGCVLSMVDDYYSKRYYVLLPLQHNFSFDDPRVSVKRVRFEYTPTYILDKLLLRALARKSTQANAALGRFEQNGLYYLVNFKKSRKAKITNKKLIAVEIDIDADWSGRTDSGEVPRCLIAKVVTFTPVEELQDASGKLYAEYAMEPRYALDLNSAMVSKSVKGEYIKVAASKFKNRVAAIELKELDLELFERTKTGVISQCLDDIKTVYGDTFCVALKSFPSHLELLPKGNEIKKHYAVITGRLLQHPIFLINTTNDEQAEQRLLHQLITDGYSVSCAAEPEQDNLNLLITHHKDTYARGQDPYLQVKQANPGVIIQNCTIENLIDAKGHLSSHVYEVLLKELFVKLELSTKQILIDNMPDALGATYIIAQRVSVAEIRYYTLQIDNARLHFGRLSDVEAGALNQLINPHHSKMFNGSNWQLKPLMYWPEQQEYLFITDTPAVPLADINAILPILVSVEQSNGKAIPKALIEQFCLQFPGNAAGMLLLHYLATNTEVGAIKVADAKMVLKEDKSLKRSEAKEQLNQWLQNYGITLWQSVKKRQDGFLQAHHGLRVFAEHRMYFSANVQSVKASYGNFSRLYRLCGNVADVPTKFYELLTPSHIRHKQYSVLPYPFKYLREEIGRLELT
ncbi:hypothetical protein [Alkalimonas amylolytica]|uniref:Uncharacterized protein n=1 Tax=Alkalimonas amylolytica TaxID=152573 RepID=A0A1H3YG56_ALKAM|nr:hypothetical protein [Alkalimonas amylolytica]SEA10543.1 hypothetical protein SAMN04488051_101675 [Alkalimonas amylolytica]